MTLFLSWASPDPPRIRPVLPWTNLVLLWVWPEFSRTKLAFQEVRLETQQARPVLLWVRPFRPTLLWTKPMLLRVKPMLP
jgi:hypothetical protein